jgi:hypothetical protein
MLQFSIGYFVDFFCIGHYTIGKSIFVGTWQTLLCGVSSTLGQTVSITHLEKLLHYGKKLRKTLVN